MRSIDRNPYSTQFDGTDPGQAYHVKRGRWWNLSPQGASNQSFAERMAELMVFSTRVSSVIPALCLLFIASASTQADSILVNAKSGQKKVAVLELYTSEGCSSCPPADRFVSRVGASGWYPRQVIPLSFHVPYWDYIGWHDSYAQDEFEKRQRDIAARQRSKSVYTPQLVLDGRDVRGVGRFGSQVQKINQRPPEASISFQVRAVDGGTVNLDLDVVVEDATQRQNSAVYIALFENGLSSQVTAGENSGKTLMHDFVVRKFIGPLELAANKTDSHHDLSIDVPKSVNLGKAGIAAFVQNTSDGSVLQALSTRLVNSSAMP